MIELRVSAYQGARTSAPTVCFPSNTGTIGGESACGMVLAGTEALHAEIVMRGGVASLRAHGPGVAVNGRPLPVGGEVGLAVGDSIDIGPYVIDVLQAPGGRWREGKVLGRFRWEGGGRDDEPASAGAEPPEEPPARAGPPVLDASGDRPRFSVARPPGRPPGQRAKPPQPSPPQPTPAEPASAGAEPSLPAPQASAPPPLDDVRLGSAAPRAVKAGRTFIVHFTAYPAAEQEKVRAMLAEQSPGHVAALGKRSCRWAAGTEVAVTIAADDLACEEPQQRFTWSGAVEVLDFVLRVPAAAPPGERAVTLRVAIAGLVVASLAMVVEVVAAGADDRQAGTTQAHADAPRTGFASYSSTDRPLVARLLGAIELSAGIDVFQDCLDLKPSETWKDRLEQEIRARELFLLFWSQASSASKWVEWEWRTALREKGLGAIQVHPIQTHVKPPPELASLHFDSLHTLVAEHEEQQARRPS